jgi:hypothetical protein
MNFYEESEFVTYKEVEWLHNLFIKKRQLKKQIWYSKWQITKYAKKLLNWLDNLNETTS